MVEINAAFEPEPLPQDATYTYNYLGQRASKTLNGATIYYLYDEQGNLLDEVDEEGQVIKAYIYMEGEYVAHIEESADLANNEESNEQLFYPINDHLGQPVQVWRADMNLAHEQYTDPFGNLYASYTNGTGAMGVTHAQTVAFPGQQRDVELGYAQNWMRDYDASSSGYLQPDKLDALSRAHDPELLMAASIGVLRLPYGMQINQSYMYAGGNPIMYYDPYGLSPEWLKQTSPFLISGGGVAFLVGLGVMPFNPALGTGIAGGGMLCVAGGLALGAESTADELKNGLSAISETQQTVNAANEQTKKNNEILDQLGQQWQEDQNRR